MENRKVLPDHKDPTASEAIGRVTREEKEKQREAERERKLLLLKDIKAVLKEARRMDCKTVNFYKVPVENLELIRAALQSYGR